MTDSTGLSATAEGIITVNGEDPLAYEGFAGIAGASLAGFGSGVGWASGSAWSGGSGATVLGDPAGFPGLPENGQAAAFRGGEDFTRPLARPWLIGDAAGEFPEVWVAFTLTNPGPVASGHEYRLALRNGGTDVLSFGKEINASWRLRSGTDVASFTGNISSANLGTWYAVVRLRFDGTDTAITGWLGNATDAGLDLADPASFSRTGRVTAAGRLTFDSVSLVSHNTSSARMDEVALASRYGRVRTLAALPHFLTDSPTRVAQTGQVFMDSIAGEVVSAHSPGPFSFVRLDGPDWLILTADGQLLGTPGAGAVGENAFVIRVADPSGNFTTGTLTIHVADHRVLARESLEGTTGTAVNGFGSGTGWQAPSQWTRFGGTAGASLLGAPGAFPGLPAAGRSLALAGGEDLRRTLGTTYAIRDQEGDWPALWLACLVNNPGPIASTHQFRLALQRDGADILSFGREASNGWQLRGGGNATAGNFTDLPGNWLAVLRLVREGAEVKVTAWQAEEADPGLDPADLTTFSRSADITLTADTFRDIAVHSTGTTTARMDEIRLAASYPAVLAAMADADADGYPDSLDPDDDNDGIHDLWETARGLNPLSAADADTDPDGDGFSSLGEFTADTDPHNPDDRLRAEISGGQLASSPTSPGRIYQWESSPDLAADSWTPLGTAMPGTGAPLTLTIPGSSPRVFYRLTVRFP